MYIKKIELTNIRNIEKLELEFPHEKDEDLAGWHVLIGDNGSGKTTILRAIALGLLGVGIENAGTYPFANSSWLKYNKKDGKIKLFFSYNFNSDDNKPLEKFNLYSELSFGGQDWLNFEVKPTENSLNLKDVEFGWFSVAFGSYRRFASTSEVGFTQYPPDMLEFRDFMPKASPRLKAHGSIFNESVIISDFWDWIHTKGNQKVRDNQHDDLLESIIKFVNQADLLPHRIELKTFMPIRGMIFLDSNNNEVAFRDLASGYRTILGIALEIIYQMTIFYPNKPIFNEDFTQVIAPGVVLIDEVDAHLHPSWQREIGVRLTKHFPNLQFIVTTHSPLVCQLPFVGEGDDKKVKGSIFRLPTPGTDEVGELLEEGSESWKRLVYGDILEAYSTGLFGHNIERSPEAQEIIKELAQLSLLRFKEPLTDEQKEQMKLLKDKLPRTPLNL